MKLGKFFTIVVLLISIPIVTLGWTKPYSGDGYSQGRRVEPTSDGGFMLFGSTGVDYTQGDFWLLKVDSLGDTMWTKKYGSERWEKGNDMVSCKDVGYALIGEGITDEGDWDIWLIRTDNNGDTLWTKTFGGENNDYGYGIEEISTGGFIVVGLHNVAPSGMGEENDNLWLLRLNENGDTLWTRSYGGDDCWDSGADVKETGDGGFIITGSSGIPGRRYLWLIKTDENGDSLWTRFYGGSSEWNYGHWVEEASDGCFIIAGERKSSDSLYSDSWFIKTDSMGDTLWTRSYGGDGYDAGECVRETFDKGYIITGGLRDLTADLCLIKTDSLGVAEWEKTYGSSYADHGYHIQELDNGCYVVIGVANQYNPPLNPESDLWLLKTNSRGDTVWYEVSPEVTGLPIQDTLVDTIIPGAWFKNWSTMGTVADFYCHCEIVRIDGVFLSPPYHVQYWVSSSLAYEDSIYVQFAEWFADDSARYEASFYTTKKDESIWTTDTVTVEFQGVPDVGIVESPIVIQPSWELTRTIGREVSLKYTNYPQGFHTDVYDATGRRIDEIHSSTPSGTVTWGKGQPPGVYFIRIADASEIVTSRVIIVR